MHVWKCTQEMYAYIVIHTGNILKSKCIEIHEASCIMYAYIEIHTPVYTGSPLGHAALASARMCGGQLRGYRVSECGE